MTNPLVTVICISYNHESFVREALNSVFNQTYENVEVIIVDDASTDRSFEELTKIVSGRKDIVCFRNENNLGNCKSFNKAFQISQGKYIIDFALDDVLEHNRIQRQVEDFEKLDLSYGVLHSNADLIDEEGTFIKTWNERAALVPQGFVFDSVLKRSFICPPTMMIRREVLEYLGGYDESLAYEDFDFWVRSSQKYKYLYSPEILTKKRVVQDSLSSRNELKGYNAIQETTRRVCEKANWLAENSESRRILKGRIYLEMRHALMLEAFSTVQSYYKILEDMDKTDFKSYLLKKLASLKIPFFSFYKLYRKFS